MSFTYLCILLYVHLLIHEYYRLLHLTKWYCYKHFLCVMETNNNTQSCFHILALCDIQGAFYIRVLCTRLCWLYVDSQLEVSVYHSPVLCCITQLTEAVYCIIHIFDFLCKLKVSGPLMCWPDTGLISVVYGK